jgi:hypothetical protein
LHGGAHLGGWTAREIHQAVLTTFNISEQAYGVNQLRYDLRKLRPVHCWSVTALATLTA